jgi:hypothetical protein
MTEKFSSVHYDVRFIALITLEKIVTYNHRVVLVK